MSQKGWLGTMQYSRCPDLLLLMESLLCLESGVGFGAVSQRGERQWEAGSAGKSLPNGSALPKYATRTPTLPLCQQALSRFGHTSPEPLLQDTAKGHRDKATDGGRVMACTDCDGVPHSSLAATGV